MTRINCPSCLRSLQAPADAGEHAGVCSGCGTSFAFAPEQGPALERVEPGAVQGTLAEAREGEEQQAAPNFVPVVERDVSFDSDAWRTQTIHATFKTVGALGLGVGFLVGVVFPLASGAWRLTLEGVGLALGCPVLLAFGVALVVAHFITPEAEQLCPPEDKLEEFYEALEDGEGLPGRPEVAGLTRSEDSIRPAGQAIEPPSGNTQPKGPQP
jgi:hypothetical protein